ncbi:hypothetical protein KY328_05125 [Candidatus Woesearchaeota archaeon]|nr:hypothetical protein [Candidatus Woesearchaeota archaeon]MBW3022281.1 hypothetical protein [Candidatus Woesearchaeota archaeon]
MSLETHVRDVRDVIFAFSDGEYVDSDHLAKLQRISEGSSDLGFLDEYRKLEKAIKYD